MNKYRMIKPHSRNRITVCGSGEDSRFVMQFATSLMDMGYTQVGLCRYVWHKIFGR